MTSYIYEHKNGICLRKVEHADLTALKELKDESWYGTHHVGIVNMFDQQRWFESVSQSKDCLYLIAELMEDVADNPVGLYKITDIDWINRSYMSAHDIFKRSRGKGHSKPVLEAGVDFGFEVLCMHRLGTEVLSGNWSLSAAEYAGFVKEGLKRKVVYRNGLWLDSIVMGLLSERWTKLPRVREMGGVCNRSIVLGNRKGRFE